MAATFLVANPTSATIKVGAGTTHEAAPGRVISVPEATAAEAGVLKGIIEGGAVVAAVNPPVPLSVTEQGCRMLAGLAGPVLSAGTEPYALAGLNN